MREAEDEEEEYEEAEESAERVYWTTMTYVARYVHTATLF